MTHAYLRIRDGKVDGCYLRRPGRYDSIIGIEGDPIPVVLRHTWIVLNNTIRFSCESIRDVDCLWKEMTVSNHGAAELVNMLLIFGQWTVSEGEAGAVSAISEGTHLTAEMIA